MSRYVFPGHAISATAGVIRRLGGDPLAIANAAGVPEAVFTDSSLTVESNAGLRFVELAAKACQCDTIGLQMGAEVDMSFLGPVWVLMQDARTVRELLQDLQRHVALFTEAILMGLLTTSEGLNCTIEIVGDADQDDFQTIEYCLCQLIRYLRVRLGVPWHSPRVQLRHGPPKDLRLHHQHLGPKVFFKCEVNGFLVETQTLIRPLENSHQGHALIVAALNLNTPPDRVQLVRKVESMVLATMPYSFPTLERVAMALILSPRNLQRLLLESGTSFNAIRDKVRADLAVKYLRQSTRTVTEITELLGYTQSSAFCRAFARWYGVSPLQYQKAQQSKK